MQNDKSAKGKGVEYDRQSVSSLSLSDCHDHIPRTADECPLSLLLVPAEQRPPQLEDYSLDKSRPARSNATPSSLGPGHAHYLVVTGRHDSTTYNEDDASTANGGAPSSSCRDRDSDVESQRSSSTASTARDDNASGAAPSSAASSAPSTVSRRSTVETHIHRQAHIPQRYQLQCEVCTQLFDGDDFHGWRIHTEAHLGGSFPSRLRCLYCEDLGDQFDSSKTTGGDRSYNFRMRMEHVRDHILQGEFRFQDRRPDGFLINHMRKKGLIDDKAYQNMLRPSRLPRIAISSQQQHRSQRALAPVEEEAGPSSSSAIEHRRSQKRRSDKHMEPGRHSQHKRKTAK